MVQPTLKNVKIRSTKDAYQVLNAVVNGCLPLVSTRITREDCMAIESGDVYVWEERQSNVPRSMGIRRWTDGMEWKKRGSIKGGLMQYEQKHNANNSGLYIRSCPTKISDRLIKQSYAVHARLPGESPYRNKRRLHITAYFNAERQKDHLTTDDFPDIRDAIVPRGRFDDPYPDNDPMYKIAFVPSELSITLQSVASQSTPNSPEIRRILDYPLPPLHSIDVHYPRRHPMDELALREFTISF